MKSHIVTLMRRPNSTNLPDDLYTESKRKLGSVYTGGGDIIRGLSFSEQKMLLPELIGVSPTEQTFTKAVRDYFLNFTIEVPMAGLDMEIGLDDEGHPINVLDYIRYKFAKAHPYVADNEAGLSSKRARYFLVDQAEELLAASQDLESRKLAYREYIKLTDSEERMDMVMRVLGHKIKDLSKTEKEIILEELAQDNPEYFLEIVVDKNLELVSLINHCLTTEVLRKVGNSIVDGDVVLGDSMEEAVLFLKDKKNSNVMTALKARIKAFS